MTDNQTAPAPCSDKEQWTQVHARVAQSDIEPLEELLLHYGALAVTLSETDSTDELWEPEPGTNPLWLVTTVTGLFLTESLPPSTIDALKADLAQLPLLALNWESMAERIWEREWLKHFQPVCISQRLWITPSSDHTLDSRAAKNDGLPRLILDPGLAFGTGTHPTTRLCLSWLCQTPLNGKTVIDYGCGSGILGIAAILLGAKQVIAIDNDPQALLATEQNAKKNGVADKLITSKPVATFLMNEQECPSYQCDVLIANILAKPLFHLCPHFAQLLNSQDGLWAISGLLLSQLPELTKRYEQHFNLSGHEQDGDWGLLHGTR